MSRPRRLQLSPLAFDDLDQISTYIAREAPVRALTFVDELRTRCKSIAASPEAWPARPDLGSGMRMAKHGRYLIVFRDLADEGLVRIERVVHGARDLRRLF